MKNYPFGVRLRDLRLAHNLTVDQVATALGCSAAKVGHLENGIRGVSIADAVKLARLFHLTLDELIPVNERGEFVKPQAAANATELQPT